MATASDIGARIQTCRARLRFSQQEMADLVGIAPSQFHRYEVGRTKPRPAMADRIADALGVSTSWLLTGEGNMERSKKDDLGTREKPGFHIISVEFTPSEAKAFRRQATARGMTPEQFMKFLMYQQFEKNNLLDADSKVSKNIISPKDSE